MSATMTKDWHVLTPGPKVDDKAIHVILEIGRPGLRRKVRATEVEVDADREMVHVSKDIIECEQFGAITKFDSRTRDHMESRCLPSQLKRGVYLLSFDLIEEVDDWLENRVAERQDVVDAFLVVYPSLVHEVQFRLRALYQANDYPTVEELGAGFYMRRRYFTYATPGKLATISRAIYDKEQAKAKAEWQAALDEAKLVLRGFAAEFLDHMVMKLTPGIDGKKKVLHASTLERLKDFCDTFPKRNIAEDRQLEEVISQARLALEGVSLFDLRKNDAIRDMVRDRLEPLKAEVGSMVTTVKRSLLFDEED